MADKKPPQGIDSSTSESKYRAKKINSMQDQLYRIEQQSDSQSNRIQKSMADIEKSAETMNHTTDNNIAASDMNKTISALNYTISSLGKGIKHITEETARATGDSISQYGKAVAEDISVNRQNTVAMALAKSTPLFGYFASKFVETDVFKTATDSMKDNISKGLGGIFSGAGSLAKNLGSDLKGSFGSGKGKVNYSQESQAAMGNVNASIKELGAKIPKMQVGGYVEKGGLAQIHPAEVVMPIDKLLARIDEQIPDRVQLKDSIDMMSESYANIETYIGGGKKGRKSQGLVQDFLYAFKNAKNFGEGKWQDRMLRAMLDLRIAMIGSTDRLQIAWQRTLVEHPTFRNLIMLGDALKTTFVSPLKFLFGIQGKYRSRVAAATRTQNVFLKLSNVMGLLYSDTMIRLDRIISLNTEMVQLAGGEGKGADLKEKTWTRLGKINKWRKKPKSKSSLMGNAFDALVDGLELDRDALAEAGITSIGDLFKGKTLKGIAKGEPVESFAKAKYRPFKFTQPGFFKAHAGEMIGTPDHMESFAKHLGKSSKRQQKFDAKAEKIINKRNDRNTKHEIKINNLKEKLEMRTARRLSWFRKKEQFFGVLKRNRIVKKSLKEENKIREFYRKKSIKYQKSLVRQQKFMLFFTEFRARRQRKLELIHQKKLSNMQAKMRKKEAKIHKKTAALRDKIEKRKITHEQKILMWKEKIEGKARYRQAKMEAKKEAAARKLEMIKQKPFLKAQRAAANRKMKSDMKKMKLEMFEAKKQARIDSKEMRQRIREARKEQWSIRRKMISQRWKQAMDLPDKIEQFRKQSFKYQTRVTKIFAGIGRKIKKIGSAIWPILMAMFSTLMNFGKSLFGKVGAVGGMAMTGIGSLASKAGIGAVGGAAALPIAAGVAGVGLMGYDAYKGVGKAKKWGTNKLAAGVGGALGGANGAFTVGGTLKGVAKGGALGAAIGSIVPGFGTAIGGAVGAIAGGLLGFIGGKNISKGLQAVGGGIKKIIVSIWKLITWPLRIMKEMMLFAKDWWLGKISSIPIIGPFLKKKGLLGKNTSASERRPGVMMGAGELAKSNVVEKLFEGKITAGEIAKSNEGISNAVKNSMDQNSRAVVHSSSAIVNSVNNMSSNVSGGGGGVPGGGTASSGDQYAHAVLVCGARG